MVELLIKQFKTITQTYLRVNCTENSGTYFKIHITRMTGHNYVGNTIIKFVTEICVS